VGPLRLLYQGTVVPEHLPLALLDAMAGAPAPIHLCVIGYETAGSPGYISDFLSRARFLGLEDQVEFLGALPRMDMLTITRTCDVGLSLIHQDPDNLNQRFMAGASCKAFDYLLAGLPLLVYQSDDWNGKFVEPGFALACREGDLTDLDRSLRWFLEHPIERKAMGISARRRLESDWNYDAQFEGINDKMENTK
jgi:glycosyltransferase involved in cell wall biosynthesis